MTRREALSRLVDAARLSLLRLRVCCARPLPVALMGALRALDAWAARYHERAER